VAAENIYNLKNFLFTTDYKNTIIVNARVEDIPGVSKEAWSYAKIRVVFNNNGGTQYRVPFNSKSQVFAVNFCPVFTTM